MSKARCCSRTGIASAFEEVTHELVVAADGTTLSFVSYERRRAA